jgi:uncharacterized protein YacL
MLMRRRKEQSLQSRPETEQQPEEQVVEPRPRKGVFMRFEFILRLLGALAFGVGGYYFGVFLTTNNPSEEQRFTAGIAMGLVMAALGVVITPYITTHPLQWILRKVQQLPAHELVAGIIGLLIGIIFSALLAIPLSMLPDFIGDVAPFVASVVLGYLGISVMILRKKDILSLFRGIRSPLDRGDGGERAKGNQLVGPKVLLDTSAIIDGRVADVSRTGFISGPMIVPRFVLEELQHIADSPDSLRRNRGRRGLEMLSRLQKDSLVPIEIVEAETNGTEVDGKLVKIARQLGHSILTNDYNLNRVAALQGVRVLNINELANALKSVVLPGEEMALRIIQEGKEVGQGVGYLDDGTMVVVEGGRRFLGTQTTVLVTRVLQTVAGRMIFAHPKE